MKITIKEWEGGIIFQRKVVPGTSDKSYGIHTAKVAGLPPELIKRAQEILQSLEIRRNLLYKGVDLEAKDLGQFTLFSQPADNTSIRYDISSATLSDIKDMLKSFDVDRSTPLEALQLIKEVKARLSSK